MPSSEFRLHQHAGGLPNHPSDDQVGGAQLVGNAPVALLRVSRHPLDIAPCPGNHSAVYRPRSSGLARQGQRQELRNRLRQITERVQPQAVEVQHRHQVCLIGAEAEIAEIHVASHYSGEAEQHNHERSPPRLRNPTEPARPFLPEPRTLERLHELVRRGPPVRRHFCQRPH